MFSPVFLSYISPMCQNACFSLIFPEKSAFRNGFELRRSDVKKDFFFNIFRRRSVESSSDNFRFFPINTVSCDIYQKTRNQFGSNATWVRIPPSAPKAAPCGALLFIFAANYARAARWDSNSPCPALCVPPGKNAPVGAFLGRGRIPPSAPSITTQFLHWVVIFCCRFVKIPYFSYKHLPFIFK